MHWVIYSCFSPFSNVQEEKQIPIMHSVPAAYTAAVWRGVANDEAPVIQTLWRLDATSEEEEVAHKMSLLVTSDGVQFS